MSYISVSGHTAFSAAQYTVFTAALRAVNPSTRLFTYKTVRYSLQETLKRICFPKLVTVGVDDKEQGRLPKLVFGAGEGISQRHGISHGKTMRVVLPSQWAKLDVATLPFYTEVFEQHTDIRNRDLSIEESMIVRDRGAAIGKNVRLWAKFKDAVCLADYGDVLTFPCSSYPRCEGSELNAWKGRPRTSLHRRHVKCLIPGTLGTLWMIDDTQSTSSRPTGLDPDEAIVFDNLLKTSWTRLPPKPQSGSNAAASKKTVSQKQSMLTSSADITDLKLFPGDVCFFLRPQAYAGPTGVVCLFVGSFLNNAYGEPPEKLVWIRTLRDLVATGTRNGLCTVTDVAVCDLPCLSPSNRHIPMEPISMPPMPNKGYLSNGERFLIYRVALYADGFKQHKSLSDTRSVAGAYLLPLGLSLKSRRSSAAARVLTLSPDTLDANHCMEAIISDVVAAAVHGVEGRDPFGRSVRIFVDPVSFFGDLPAVAEASSIIGHRGTACCTLCAFHKKLKGNGPQITYTSTSHSRRLGLMRFDKREQAIRRMEPHPDVLRMLGMKATPTCSERTPPLVVLSRKLEAQTPKYFTDDGSPVVPLMFDSNLSAAAAPDHLLTRLALNVIALCFDVIRTDEERAQVESKIVSCAHSNGMAVGNHFLRWNKNGSHGGTGPNRLVSLTMSHLFSILLCAAAFFQEFFDDEQEIAYLLPQSLQKVVSAFFRTRDDTADGVGNAMPPPEEHPTTPTLFAHGSINRAVACFLERCTEAQNKYGEIASVLDKPNAHRLVELGVHTVPNFGHGRNCSEMVLEQVHRHFKGSLEKNTHAHSHLTAMDKAVSRDWLSRLHVLVSIWQEGAVDDREKAEMGLRRLLLGEEALEIDDTERSAAELMHSFRESLKQAFEEPVASQLALSAQGCVHYRSTSMWEVVTRLDVDDNDSELHGPLLRLRDMMALDDSRSTTDEHCQPFNVYRTARFVTENGFGGRLRCYPFNTLERGCAVSVVVVNDGTVVEASGNGDGVLSVFAINAVCKGQGKDVWLIVRRMKQVKDAKKGVMSSTGSGLQLLRLDATVRRVFLMHHCDENCKRERSNMITHSAEAHNGGVFTVVTRRDGYPPHLG